MKSYTASLRRVIVQIDRHLARVRCGMTVDGHEVPAACIDVSKAPVRMVIVPGRWRLPRSFHFEDGDRTSDLCVDPPQPPTLDDEVLHLGGGRWGVRLRWSQEALASIAHEMTFWYMGKIGEVIYRDGVPAQAVPMDAEEAGRNAAKMMLYYAILRARSPHENEAATALYNAYSFGYALGSSFRNAAGRHAMLSCEDLREILERGVTKNGSRLKGWRLGRREGRS